MCLFAGLGSDFQVATLQCFLRLLGKVEWLRIVLKNLLEISSRKVVSKHNVKCLVLGDVLFFKASIK